MSTCGARWHLVHAHTVSQFSSDACAYAAYDIRVSSERDVRSIDAAHVAPFLRSRRAGYD
jgi:hypothetical protein